MSVDRVLDGELVQAELACDRLELLCRRFEDAEPDEGVGALFCGLAGIDESEIAAAALTVFVDGAVDDHMGKYRRSHAALNTAAASSADDENRAVVNRVDHGVQSSMQFLGVRRVVAVERTGAIGEEQRDHRDPLGADVGGRLESLDDGFQIPT
ncbi:MAG TPA: hypothetical protein VHM66_02660 [Solirubrobacterales bacterium]|nr:hypothetical protein [Solirubrobacterales bacterium]